MSLEVKAAALLRILFRCICTSRLGMPQVVCPTWYLMRDHDMDLGVLVFSGLARRASGSLRRCRRQLQLLCAWRGAP